MTGPVAAHAPGEPKLLLGAYDIASLGYTDDEYFVSGSASAFASVAELGADGRWEAIPSGSADYTTRIVVLKPSDPARFNGTVVVEWLNVSGGIDAPAVWFMAHRELVRRGYAYVAVSAQQVGIEGGASLGMDMSLKKQDPERYWRLNHPEDAYAYDIFSQAGQLVRGARSSEVLGPLKPEYVVAVGESQSAMFLTTYVNAIDPIAQVYDGFLIHSRFGPAAPLDGTSIFAQPEAAAPRAVKFRDGLRVPLMTVLTETDVVGGLRPGYHLARQPDTERLRTWEIPGTAHADNYTIQVSRIDSGFAPLQELVAAYAPTDTLMGQRLPHFINFAPQHHYVLQAAIAGLHDWIRDGTAPATAAPMELGDTDPPRPVLDANGLAMGGVRTPWVDVPIARTSGIGSAESPLSHLFGSGEPFDAATLTRLYPGGATEYLDRFTTSLDEAIRSGFLLSADREEILQLAAATYP
ncbi:alpha/beta hydrolase domain-containing protein [Mycobacterium sp. CVI_P3]|uniref:Alpha/beta hydrolase domain-containing protein n=1 Tax=Mycobacterium pinniadriaticum TaxID=2994102 RepID=A0ABT3SHW7_9MYCO|nr:alpha/beta hydrolase domain-containing protein [Mycobacterium pinniadriaticum]MCX2932028.1 alpha/beta hydrolase domain-containing protein [Mycobacterium pinniadriaticum]MCX2938452.1 alpha/beta hydrolase domain-containing protein [Mycobacterium pinniadriaticum]